MPPKKPYAGFDDVPSNRVPATLEDAIKMGQLRRYGHIKVSDEAVERIKEGKTTKKKETRKSYRAKKKDQERNYISKRDRDMIDEISDLYTDLDNIKKLSLIEKDKDKKKEYAIIIAKLQEEIAHKTDRLNN